MSAVMFSEVNAVLSEQGLTMKHGSVVDVTLIATQSSTKNQDKQRDVEMTQTLEGQSVVFWHKGAYRRPYGKRPCPYG
jgi:IS5 family transposase